MTNPFTIFNSHAYATYYIMNRLVEAGVLTEDEKDNEQHVDMMETVEATVV